MLDENLAFFSIFGGVLRTAAKNRKKCLIEKNAIPRLVLAKYFFSQVLRIAIILFTRLGKKVILPKTNFAGVDFG